MTATTAPGGDDAVVAPTRWTASRLGSLLLVIGVTALVGFLAVGQVRGGEAFKQRLEAENEGDLTRILAGLTTEADALRDEISQLKLQLLQLQNSNAADSASTAAAEAQLRALRVLAGTVPVSGPGLTVKIEDPEGAIQYDTFIDVAAELRDAGAEALAINNRRVGAGSAFGELADHRITIDGIAIEAPYTLTAIGSAATLEGGLKIPGGALDVLNSLRGVAVDLQRSAKLDVPALANPPRFHVGKPAS